MKQLYAVILTFRNSRRGYHSVYQNEAVARFQCDLRNMYADYGMSYHIEAVMPTRIAHDYCRQVCVSLQDSVGMLLVDTRSISQIDTHSVEWLKVGYWRHGMLFAEEVSK